MNNPDTKIKQIEPSLKILHSIQTKLGSVCILLCTIISIIAASLLIAGQFKPYKREFSVAPGLNIFIYPYGFYQDIAFANYGYTGMIDMKYIQSKYKFEACGIHFIMLKWPDFTALSLRIHLLYPTIIFALPLMLVLVCRFFPKSFRSEGKEIL